VPRVITIVARFDREKSWVSGVEGEEKEKKASDFEGRVRDFSDVVPRRRGSGKFKFPSRFLLGKVEEIKV